MPLKIHIQKNTFRDSVYLMRLSSLIREMDGIEGAEVIVATDHNKKFLTASGLWSDELEQASPNDLVIAVKAADPGVAEAAIQKALAELDREAEGDGPAGAYRPRTFETALQQLPGANLALVSIPGRYVRREVERILDAGLHVMIFSDNVPLEDEVALKEKALAKGLLVMGPDCGTAIINGVPLAFANVVRRGSIGIVAASGTGLQEVSSLVHNLGGGISHGIGTGGRDIKEAVGGRMMLQGLKALMEDESTEVIVIVSKPPHPAVMERVLQAARESKKPVVVNFLGGDPEKVRQAGCLPAATLSEAAATAVRLANINQVEPDPELYTSPQKTMEVDLGALKPEQRYLRGLFSGGTLAYESLLLLGPSLGPIYSNLSLEPQYALADVYQSREHCIIDFGEDELTQGRLHPMIDPALRNRRIVTEASDPQTAVIMIDLVLGYNAHPDPAGAALEAITAAKAAAAAQGRHLIIVASVCGTDDDPQNRREQIEKLKANEVRVFPSNAAASFYVRDLLTQRGV